MGTCLLISSFQWNCKAETQISSPIFSVLLSKFLQFEQDLFNGNGMSKVRKSIHVNVICRSYVIPLIKTFFFSEF